MSGLVMQTLHSCHDRETTPGTVRYTLTGHFIRYKSVQSKAATFAIKLLISCQKGDDAALFIVTVGGTINYYD